MFKHTMMTIMIVIQMAGLYFPSVSQNETRIEAADISAQSVIALWYQLFHPTAKLEASLA